MPQEQLDRDEGAVIDLSEGLDVAVGGDRHGLILVVEDEPDLRLLAAMALERRGHSVVTAGDGLEALERLRDPRVDVAVVDLRMPRMDGRALLARMQADEQLRRVPVIVLTAHGGPNGVVDALAQGAHDYLSKPYSSDELAARVSSALRVRRLEDALRARNHEQAVDLLRLRRLEAELCTAEERFRIAFQNAPIGMALAGARLGPPAGLLKVNSALAALTGRSEDELLGGQLVDLVAPPDRDAHASGLARLGQAGLSTDQAEERIVHASGEIRWALRHTSLVRDDEGRPVYLVHQIEDITERRLVEERLSHRALHDSLTNLPNRILFMDRVSQALARIEREPGALAVLFCDLDSFKVVNDSLSHDVGDQLLIAMAERISSVLRPTDSAARIGGDEFVVLCESISSEAEATAIADRLAAQISRPVEVGGTKIYLTVSIGIAGTFSGDAVPAALLRDADLAMYQAKRSGKARSVVCDQALRRTAMDRLHLENALRAGLAAQEMALYYQPIVDVATGSISGVEALIRWQRPGHVLLVPSDFLEVAEESRLIIDIGAWALGEACRQSAEWSAGFPNRAPLQVAVNLSGHQLDGGDLADVVRQALQVSGADPANLCLEVTESVLVEVTSSTLEDLRDLKNIGVRFAIDDFGTGFSSFTYLKRFPVDAVKVDKSFVSGLGTEADDEAIVGAVVALGRGLHLDTIAEGVETARQLERLRELGCHHAQGYLFARPVPANELSAMLVGTTEPAKGG